MVACVAEPYDLCGSSKIFCCSKQQVSFSFERLEMYRIFPCAARVGVGCNAAQCELLWGMNVSGPLDADRTSS
jgi:hypothetical protein